MAVVKNKNDGSIIYSGAASGMAGLDLSNGVFMGMMTTGAPSSESNLSGASFVGTNLSGAIFSFAYLSGVDFTGANLTGADFTGATVTGCTWADLTGYDNIVLDQAVMNGSTFTFSSPTTVTGWSCVATTFGSNAFGNFTAVSFDMSDAGMWSATMTGTGTWSGTWNGSNVHAVDMTIAPGQYFYGGTLKATSGVYYQVSFEGTTFLDPYFVGNDAVFASATFTGCTFLTSMTSRNLTSCNFYRCDFNANSALNCDLSSSNFYDSHISAQVFGSGTTLSSTSFTKCSLYGPSTMTMIGSYLGSLTFTKCTIDALDVSLIGFLGSLYFVDCRVSQFIAEESTIVGNITFTHNNVSAYPSTLCDSVLPASMVTSAGTSSMTRVAVEPGTQARGAFSPANSSWNGYGYNEAVTASACWVNWCHDVNTSRSNGEDYGNSQLTIGGGGGTHSGGSIQNATAITGAGDTLPYTKFMGVDMKGVDFSALTRFAFCDFIGCDLSHANFDGLDLVGSTFRGCNVYNATFSGCTNLNLSGSFQVTTTAISAGATLWNLSPLVDTVASNSYKVYAMLLTAGSRYTLQITSGGGTQQQLFLMSPRQATENVRTGFSSSSSDARYKYSKGYHAQAITDNPEVGPFLARSTGYHYLWLANATYSSSFTLEAVVT